jgi:diguanylate cyclase (GGDEF)-like protein
MADIDDFKPVNDTFGHVVGDDVLRSVAKILTSKCNGRNRLEYRYGGEELAAILTGDEASRATEVAESIRADVERLRLDAQPDLKLTISLDIAAAPDVGRNAAELVKLADAALYRGKEEGRNCVRTAD